MTAGPVTLAWGAATDVGLRRSLNEDSHLAAPPLFLVADGMGGHQAGEVASATVIEEFARLMLVSVEKNVAEKNGTSTRGKRHETKCLGKYEGIEFNPTFSLPGVGDYVGKACYFTHDETHYIARYDVIQSHAASDAALLEKILKATELKDLEE